MGFTHRQLERIVRGFSNHRRIQLLYLLQRQPEMSVNEIAREVRSDFRTISEHLRRLAIAGLVVKRNQAQSVRHAVTERGRAVLTFLKTVK
jgi:predicted transcriptional regulator